MRKPLSHISGVCFTFAFCGAACGGAGNNHGSGGMGAGGDQAGGSGANGLGGAGGEIDLWAHRDIVPGAAGYTATAVPPHGTVMLKVTGN
jgi:hypothetical protein